MIIDTLIQSYTVLLFLFYTQKCDSDSLLVTVTSHSVSCPGIYEKNTLFDFEERRVTTNHLYK